MASAEQLKALFKSHIDGDEDRFFSIAMQVAAHEAVLGHGRLALELRSLVDEGKLHRNRSAHAVPINQPRGELANLLGVSYPKARLSDLILDDLLASQLKRIIREQQYLSKIREHGLSPRRKLLLVGPPGTGKTLTASVLAGEFGLPLFLVRLDSLITKYMGETAAKLRQIFEAITNTRGVYFFDEFDAIGSQRGSINDVGEARRILNSFLQVIDEDKSNNVIIAATNHAEILDYALFRRFDDVLQYELPNREQIVALLKTRLANFFNPLISWENLAEVAAGLSYAEIARASEEAIKDVLIHNERKMTSQIIGRMLEERQIVVRKHIWKKN